MKLKTQANIWIAIQSFLVAVNLTVGFITGKWHSFAVAVFAAAVLWIWINIRRTLP